MTSIVRGAGAGLLSGLALLVLVTIQPNMMALDGGPFTRIGLAAGAVLIGVLLGLAGPECIRTPGAGIVWGMSFGVLLWGGSLVLLPMGELTMTVAQDLFSLLVAAILTSGLTGLLYYAAATLPEAVLTTQVLASALGAGLGGGLAGLLGGLAFSAWMQQTGFFPLVARLIGGQAPGTGQALHLAISVIIGVSYGLLFFEEIRGLGPHIAWGAAYGIVWWILGPLTAQPLLLGEGLQWTLEGGQAAFAPLIGHIIYGIILGITYALLRWVWHVLFVASDPLYYEPEGAGTRSLRTVLLGGLASLVGGLLFTIVMVGTDQLAVVASLVGTRSQVIGFLVHMLISAIIGVTYGFLFRRETPTYGVSALWGASYGLVWWFVGPLTLLPTLLGQPLQWSLAGAVAAYPSLMGHLLYGVGVALTYHALSRRFDPGVRQARIEHSTYTGTEPALWAILIVLGMTLPLLFVPG